MIEDSSTKEENIISIYIQQLSPIEKIAMEIAQEHLGTSFDIQKSNGFIEWSKKKASQ